MKRFIQNIKNIWKVEELRKRILLTLSLILIYRLGSFIIIPGVNYTALAQANQAGSANVLEDLLSLFSGGGFTNASIMALGIMPYISASIIMQLLGMAVPAVQKMQNEGESGRKRINNYTRILTIGICALQAPSYLALYVKSKGAMPADETTLWWVQTILVLVAGAMFAVWLGERITEKGIGNGISLLITVGILARLPQSFISEVGINEGNLIKIVLEIVAFMVVVMATIFIVQGVRKIPLNTAKRVVGSRSVEDAQGARNYLPIKVNASGVMPIIFAQAIVTIPMMLFASNTETPSKLQTAMSDPYGLWYNVILAVLIIVFTYFYTAIMINPKKIADDLKRSGGFIPGVRPGEETADYIDSLVSRITFPGSLFLAAIAIIPAIASLAGVNGQFAMFFGGTSILIMVGVVLDTLQQIESYLLNRHMDGLMEGTRVKGRRSANELSGF
ncbi:preprotein translocase subunit SecY [Crocinitomicaceae bacterium CZZ-1]|uniref:Protein translocase subunit SecY n=1 Tax=Taishania pollutisoli TaxID=2766479 RepID=A0A8J6P7X6_9FLAO|nr:preprotein translocase subunit SecY [Taishania pollutisoli]MBC9811626.1 preprotein translocase subunit SecY [Taishania pollutisoli]MBX2948439.1 preprotein translocase subunit SecY [Crocinitomicaceae bacterium]NGF75537.1 preprotein translocase subunit SecY [Fluviicola sp. SGL-29]